MLDEQMLYLAGLILVSLFLIMGIDDFFWDMFTLFRRSSYKKQLLDLHMLDRQPPKLLAVVVAAWREDNVLGEVIENIIDSTHYPKSMYHIFLGVYPNDEPTLDVAHVLSGRYANVHVVVNELAGPTTKAQNVNYVIRQVKLFEKQRQWRFAALTIHDSEDVVHPYELKVTNYLLEKHEALQFPVFPIMQMPTFSNFFKNITTGTYADEFAENHFITMVSRYSAGAFVPSAGTGFALSRKTLESFADEDVLPKESLTEDYRLSLILFGKGVRMYYVLQRVPRINYKNELVLDFISTRSMFPSTFKTAVKQKTRWILGITMQSFQLRDVFEIKGISLIGRYSLFKDLKAKIGNLLTIAGYPFLLYFFASFFIQLPAVYPKDSLSWYLSIVVTFMMLERQLYRCIAINKVYGLKSVFFACLLPPIIPIRLVWGNIINLVATLNAYKQNIFASHKPVLQSQKQVDRENVTTTKNLAWEKTDHHFLQKHVLKRYHRNLGDVLLEKGYITAEYLQKALKEVDKEKQLIGRYLVDKKIITQEQLLIALSHIKHIQFIDIRELKEYALWQFADFFDEKLLANLLCIPLLKKEQNYVFAFCDDSPNDAQSTLRNVYNIKINAVFTSRKSITKGLDLIYNNKNEKKECYSPALQLFKEGFISYEQLILVRSYQQDAKATELQMLREMGLCL